MTNIDISIPAILDRAGSLPAMVERAARTLASAKNAAEILEAHEAAKLAYDAAKRAARLSAAQSAFNEIRAKITRAQAEALELEAAANRRLADEYDAAQERGEVAERGKPVNVPDGNNKPTSSDLGISRKQIHEARMVRDAEEAQPGVVKAAIEEAIEAGEEPTRAKVRRAVMRTVKPEAPLARPSRGKDAICKRVREAICALSGLPPPSEVLGYFAGTDEAVLVNERLSEAATWLAAFADLWPEDANAEAAE